MAQKELPITLEEQIDMMKKEDIRTITFDKGYDVVLNMADGAIGYLEDDEENHKIFSVIAKALKNGGKHFMDIINGSVFENHNGRHLLPFFT